MLFVVLMSVMGKEPLLKREVQRKRGGKDVKILTPGKKRQAGI